MLSHIHSTTVVVADQDAALDFYVNTLGWEKRADDRVGDMMRWLTVAPPGATTELALGHQSWFTGDHTVRKGGHTGISIAASDIDKAYETLTARGVQFKEPVSEMPWGARATWFYDPDGNEFFLVAA